MLLRKNFTEDSFFKKNHYCLNDGKVGSELFSQTNSCGDYLVQEKISCAFWYCSKILRTPGLGKRPHLWSSRHVGGEKRGFLFWELNLKSVS